MEETYTPGPWKVDHLPIRTPGAADRATIYPAGCSHISMRIANVKGAGNINLIAASPDLLKALEKIQRTCARVAMSAEEIKANLYSWSPAYVASVAYGIRIETDEIQKLAIAAIAKAKGEA